MNATWILLDTETTGFGSPIFVVELAAQRMLGWDSDGPPFRKLLNQNADIPPAASRVHGYTREILERDGDPPVRVYWDFAQYAGKLPLVSFNLEYDLDEVLRPEWKRLAVPPSGTRGFCALRLAQRLLDPVPAGNCKLQTLRQYYRLPERGAHTALGDVQTVADLLASVLRPIAEHRGLDTWEKVIEYAEEEWYPSRVAFGKHKGRLIQEARRDADLRRWLEWLAASSNPRTARMGRWYLGQLLVEAEPPPGEALFTIPVTEREGARPVTPAAFGPSALVLYSNPELEQLRQLVAGARARLAELEATYTREKSRVDVVQAALFGLLREHYQRRDRLRLVVDYRKRHLDALIRGREEETQQAQTDYEQAKARTDSDYEQAAADVSRTKRLSADEGAELTTLWRTLVKLYHPDRFAHQPDKLDTYHKLTAAINRAKDNGDIALLREIAGDPAGFILRQGWATLDFGEEEELTQLRRLYDTLQIEIINALESLNQLRESPDYELCQITDTAPQVLTELAAARAAALAQEGAELERQAAQLTQEIEELSGEAPAPVP